MASCRVSISLYMVTLLAGGDCANVARHASAEANAKTVFLRGEILDAQNEKPITCRIYIGGANGSWHFAKSDSPRGTAVEYRKKTGGNPPSVEMHTTLSAHPFTAELPAGDYTVLVERGKEYFPETRRGRWSSPTTSSVS